ncbi:HAMP domain-containing histidine kinase [Rhizobium sp. TH2]|uniref:sensor histidine kinase n=1 Tax=Rhizobium sp. TH2 TaxID=2775403 RepID=UPI0021578D22|nr:HAMP domain-containing sensor histidine kinase [Rhizobium sp. TH2]UVC09114.1 HAMP domain-containing histidine kinase [Rhizobium sp. TH2]
MPDISELGVDKAVKTAAILSPAEGDRIPVTSRLSTKFLALTVIFVVLAEILIFVPSVTDMRLSWLRDRLNTAAAAAIVVDGLPDVELPRPLQDDTLMATGTKAIALHKADITRMIVVSDMPPRVNARYDLSDSDFLTDARDAFATLLFGGDQVFSVRGPIGESGMDIELVMGDKALRKAMLTYTKEILLFTVIISFITASMIFLVINRTLIRPIARMTSSMQAFAEDPSNPGAIVQPPKGDDELALAARHLASMQGDLQKTIRQQKNLADLGLAVSKINHDMRNILSSAQLMSDRLADADDPVAKGLSSKLVRTLGRAIGYSSEVLSYGRASETAPRRGRIALRPLVEDAGEILGLSAGTDISFAIDIPRDLEIDADPEQLFRVLYNLCRNSLQALEADDGPKKAISVTASRNDDRVQVTVDDTGPGMPQKAKENLFSAFRGSVRAGGTGLGLAIARELIEAHRGWIVLEDKDERGTRFRFEIPDRTPIT